ncbi:unnamed protein product [marine sediment metagenome]|uniref:Uncharacterized protein n=1 Tax=marine sediment metagenome TaxID=412755 RepID=X1AZ02_9ZZZZ
MKKIKISKDKVVGEVEFLTEAEITLHTPPKHRPPRHDLRRLRVDKTDPDLKQEDEKDPDLVVSSEDEENLLEQI